MKVEHAFSVDLQPFTDYPDEEEELISPGVCFTVHRIEFDQNNKCVIYLNLVQQFNRELVNIFFSHKTLCYYFVTLFTSF